MELYAFSICLSHDKKFDIDSEIEMQKKSRINLTDTLFLNAFRANRRRIYMSALVQKNGLIFWYGTFSAQKFLEL